MPIKNRRPYDGIRASNELPRDLTTRSLSLRLDTGGVPITIDEKARSVEVICSTENPVEIFDWERWEIIPEILLMSGCQIPESRQIPLLDTHYRGGVSSVYGSCRDLRTEGNQLLGRAIYSQDEDAEKAWRKTREGHLTDYSIGYRVIESYYVPEGEKQVIAGRTFEGPVKVATSWRVRELSTCPIGADEMAKARAATSDSEHNPASKEHNAMNERLRKFLESRGLAKTATEEEAWRFLATLEIRTEGKLPEGLTEADLVRSAPAQPGTPATTGLTAADVQRQAQEIARTEISRREEIRAMCDFYGFTEQARELIDGNKTIEQARAAIMAKHMEATPTAGGVGFRAQLVVDERDKFRAAAQDGLLLRAHLHQTPDKPAAGALDLRGYSLVEVARESLRMAGQPFGGDPMQMLGRAMTTSDFPVLLGNVANLSVMAGWDAAEESWDRWADGTGSVANFQLHTMARAGETDDLDEIGEDGEYKYGKLSEQSEQYKVATFGKISRITRQMLINDALGEITQAFANRGEAAARKVGDVAYAVLIANSAMGDNVALFHSDHGNLGTAGVISEITAAEGIKLMGLQKDIAGKRRLNLSPRFFIGPKTIEGAAEIFFSSNQFAGASTDTTRSNPYAGTRFERVYDSRLDDASTTAFYFAGPKGKTVKLFFLNGNRTPFLETKEGWTIDGVEFKTRIDVGAKAIDWRGLVKNAGQ